MSDAGRLVQLQGFAKIEYSTNTVKFILLNKDGNPINASNPPLVFSYDNIFDKQVFTTKIGDNSVQFVNALIDVTEGQYNDLKELTHSVANWRTTDIRTLMASAEKDPTRPPRPKEFMANSLREWHPQGDMLASISHVDTDRV